MTPPTDPDLLPEAVGDRVLRLASMATKQPVDALSIGRYRAETWSDGCLGLGGPAEICLAALTDGWEVEVLTPNQTLVYRTDVTGMNIRRDGQDSGSRDRLHPATRDRLLATAAT